MFYYYITNTEQHSKIKNYANIKIISNTSWIYKKIAIAISCLTITFFLLLDY